MIKITLPIDNTYEREYIIKLFFLDFLGLDYYIEFSQNQHDYSICFDGSEIIFKDSFFSLYPEGLSYLESTLPDSIIFTRNDFIVDLNIPIIYGTTELIIEDHRIICGIDIFASAYFMLSRWEEYRNTVRDSHQRFPGIESSAFKNQFLHRPIVNEYVEMLWNMMACLGFNGTRAKRDFDIVLTHDIDTLSYVSVRSIAGDLIKRHDPGLAIRNSKYLITQDPFDKFDFLMTISEKIGVKSHFYFMSSKTKTNYDTDYYINRKLFKSKIQDIIRRDHVIGFHPGYYTYTDNESWCSEKKLLESVINRSIFEGRQHFLRMDITKTLSIWDKNHMKIDSTLGYADIQGFRCGTGDLFTVFDFLKRTELKLKERPLIIMDGTLHQYQKYSSEKVLEIIQQYINVGKKYKSGITLLFHNSSFYNEWKYYIDIYKTIPELLQ